MDKEDHKILNLGIFWTFASAGVRIHEVLTQGLGDLFSGMRGLGLIYSPAGGGRSLQRVPTRREYQEGCTGELPPARVRASLSVSLGGAACQSPLGLHIPKCVPFAHLFHKLILHI